MRYSVNVGFILLIVAANLLMNMYFVKSMAENGAAKATVQNFSINYLASIAFGAIVFKEKVTPQLGVGVALILAGTALIVTQMKNDTKEKSN